METLIFSKLVKHIWVIILGMFLGATAAYLYAQMRPAEYQVQARLLVGPGIDSARPDYDVLRVSGQLILTYAELPLTEPFLQGLIQDLDLKRQPDELAKMINVRPNPETQILTIEVQSPDAQEAQSIAYLTANKLVNASPSNPDSSAVQVKNQIQSQATELEQSVALTKSTLAQMEADYQHSLADERQAQTNGEFSDATLKQLDKFEADISQISDAANQQTTGTQILQELVANTNARIVQFEYELDQTTNPITQQVLGEQLRLERMHLSELRQTSADLNTSVEGMPLDQYIAATQQQVTDLQNGLTKLYTYDLRRLQYDQITEMQNRLSSARAIEADRQQKILAQIAKERERISDVTLARNENQRMIQDRIAQEQSRLTDMQNTLAILYNSMEAPDPNQVKILELGSPVPVVPPLSLMLLIGMFAGAFLGTGIILGIGAMTDTIETSDQISELIPAPVVDITVGHSLLPSLFSRRMAQRKTLERFQMLGMHMLYGQDKLDHQVILVGSVDSHADSGTVAANLATFLSQSGKRIILIDANIEHPTITRSFQLEQHEGLAEMMSDPGNTQAPMVEVDKRSSLLVLPAGHIPSKMMFLNVPQMATQLERLKNRADVVLIAAPPLLRPDSLSLSAHSNGVVAVVTKSKTTRQTLEEIVENFELVGARILSIAMTAHSSIRDKFLPAGTPNGLPANDQQAPQLLNRTGIALEKSNGSESMESRTASTWKTGLTK